VQPLLYVAADVGYIDKPLFCATYEQARTAKALIGGFKRSLLTAPDTCLRPSGYGGQA
jgi:hypothetical protein